MPTRTWRAIISDMDGVITDTARIHEAAWKQIFDDFLLSHAAEFNRPQPPFSPEDYRKHVDGKARLTGIRDFFAARGITVAEGAPDDPPEQDSIYGLSRRKNATFLQKLEQLGVQVYEDSLRAFSAWRRQGLKIAVVSASKNCRLVLRRAGLEDRFDTIVDGLDTERQGLKNKAGQIREAAHRLGVPLRDTVLLEDATSGVQAGKQAGVGLVIGVDRHGQPEALTAAGADLVVRGLTEVELQMEPEFS